MFKLEFRNATATDSGYGLEVNGKSLEDIISTALGCKAGNNKAGYQSNILNSFHSNSCDITVIIDPHPVIESIEDGTNIYESVKDLEEYANEQYEKKVTEADTEE